MNGLLKFLTGFGILLGFLPGFNRVTYELTAMIDQPTVIGGLGWTLDAPIIGMWQVQLGLTIVGLGASKLLGVRLENQAAADSRLG